MIKKKKQSGALLLELVLALSILSLFLAGILVLIKRYEDKIRFRSVAAQMNQILVASEGYVKDHYSEVYNTILINNFDTLSLSKLTSSGYLSEDKTLTSFYGEEIRPVVLMQNKEMHLFILHQYTNQLTLKEVTEISSMIKGGYGGILFGAGAINSPCSNTCLRGFKGAWLFDTLPVSFNVAFSSFETNGHFLLALHKKIGSDSAPFVHRKNAWGNLSANSLSTDLNLVKRNDLNEEEEINIFFNGLESGTNDKIGGLQLTYDPGDSTTGKAPSLTLLGDAAPGETNPLTAMLSSDGGIGTDLIISDLTAACSPNGLLAMDEKDNFLQCVNAAWLPLRKDAFVRQFSIKQQNVSAYLVNRDEIQIIVPASDLRSSDVIIGYFE